MQPGIGNDEKPRKCSFVDWPRLNVQYAALKCCQPSSITQRNHRQQHALRAHCSRSKVEDRLTNKRECEAFGPWIVSNSLPRLSRVPLVSRFLTHDLQLIWEIPTKSKQSIDRGVKYAFPPSSVRGRWYNDDGEKEVDRR